MRLCYDLGTVAFRASSPLRSYPLWESPSPCRGGSGAFPIHRVRAVLLKCSVPRQPSPPIVLRHPPATSSRRPAHWERPPREVWRGSNKKV
jgi:hypothetical protein